MGKSYVTMEQKQCVVCGEEYDTDAILLDRRMQPKFDMETITGPGLCPDDEKLNKEGYVALIAIDPDKSSGNNRTINPKNAHRTGKLVHMRRATARKFFNMPKGAFDGTYAFVDEKVLKILEERVKQVDK